MAKPKLLVIAERYPPEGGGAELATHLIIDVLRRYFDIVVLTGVMNPVQYGNIEYLYDPLLSRWEKPILWLNTLKLVESEKFRKLLKGIDIVYVPRMAFPLVPYVKKHGKKVVVHLHDYVPVTYAAAVLAPFEEHGGRVHIDSIGIECYGRGPIRCMSALVLNWLPRLARKWISYADGVLCVSKRHAKIVKSLAPELKEKITVMYNPVPKEWFMKNKLKNFNDSPLFLYVGGDSYVKGFRVLTNALNSLCKKDLLAKFIFTGNYSPKSIRLLNTLSEKCVFDISVIGRVNRDLLEQVYLRSWALLFPSILEEPLPYALAEAIAFRALPIASKVGGVPELLSGTPAENFMFRPRDHTALASLVSLVARMSVDEVHRISRDVSERVRRLTIHTTELLVRYFKSLA